MSVKQIPDPLYKSYRAAPSLRPTARPVDTFVRSFPDAEEGSELRQLAQSLSAIQPSLSAFFMQKKGEIDETDIAEGRKAYETNKLEFKEFLKAHPEMKGYSPHFQKGYREMWLREQARRMYGDLRNAYTQGATIDISGRAVDVRMAEDPQAFETWKAGFQAEWVTKNLADVDPVEFNDSFLPLSEQFAGQLTQLHTEQRAAAYVSAYKDSFTSEIYTVALNAADDPMFDTALGRAQIIEEMGAFLTHRTAQAISEGLLPVEANDMAVEAAVRAARSVGGEKGMQLLDAITEAQAGTGSLGNIAKYKMVIDAAKDTIAEEYMTLEMKEYQYQQMQENKASDIVMEKYYGEMWANPGRNWDNDILKVDAEYGYAAAESMRQYLGAIRTSHKLDARGRAVNTGEGGTSLGNQVLNLQTQVELGFKTPEEAEAELKNIIASGGAKTESDLKMVLAAARDIHGGVAGQHSTLMTTAEGLLKPAFLQDDSGLGFFDPKNTEAYLQARQRVSDQLRVAIDELGESNPTEMNKRITDIVMGVINDPILSKSTAQEIQKAKKQEEAGATPAIAPRETAAFLRTLAFNAPPGVPIPYLERSLFTSRVEFFYGAHEWAANPLDPGNGVVAISRRLGITPQEFLLAQAALFGDKTREDVNKILNAE